jgi:hypothetical protein
MGRQGALAALGLGLILMAEIARPGYAAPLGYAGLVCLLIAFVWFINVRTPVSAEEPLPPRSQILAEMVEEATDFLNSITTISDDNFQRHVTEWEALRSSLIARLREDFDEREVMLFEIGCWRAGDLPKSRSYQLWEIVNQAVGRLRSMAGRYRNWSG